MSERTETRRTGGTKRLLQRFKTIYWQNFLLTAGVVLLTLLLLGASFFALSYNYALGERSDEMKSNAEVVSRMVASYVIDGSLSGMQELASFAGSVTDEDFLICNLSGNVLLTSDASLANRVLTLPKEVTEGVLEGKSRFQRTTL
ncbi:MAG: hypothetical protein II079_00970, partial [Oscillospiraceae bacterium]|nr:hypothetical protein [Oscillospiraceae bacterium]